MRVRLALTVLTALAPLGAGTAPASAGCPLAVATTSSAFPAAVAFARASQPNAELVGLFALTVDSIGTDDHWRAQAAARCGARVARRSWVAFYLRPHYKDNVAFADGVSYIARTPAGFRVWYRAG